ncbi:hypothetical protein TNIN_45811 [Trichonephila inaurata madagascariensis]|uniref:Uncharacterized protein n=1 Tax=Trichonephila inaurata madagascariensis TaxID=2747483 RepID=A0A8X6KFD3_9ARAC|nr:hypothetical protein TNIN_45811 [Trichonephila inaurata madagascariensis]
MSPPKTHETHPEAKTRGDPHDRCALYRPGRFSLLRQLKPDRYTEFGLSQNMQYYLARCVRECEKFRNAGTA